MGTSQFTELVLLMFHLLCLSQVIVEGRPPNIVLIVADDYGWNDIGYHGSEINTPCLDKLAAEGVKLERYYVQPICSPTRSQLLSGRYQIHTGLQHSVILPAQANGLPLSVPTLPDKLREAGYATHMVGKWHLGYYKKEYMPNYRGFDSFYGFLNGGEDHFSHIRCYGECGLDMRDNLTPDRNQTGVYSAHLFTSKAQGVIKQHAEKSHEEPLFLYVPFQSVHSPMEVPDEYLKPYSFIKNNNRRIYAGMVAALDEAVQNITTTLKETGLWNNTLLVFSTDNGGQVHAGGNNWPLRGYKDTLWEGGIRGLGFVTGPAIPIRARGGVSQELMHVSDWFPTLLHVARGSTSGLKLDGYNMWDTISSGGESPRRELLHNIDPLYDLQGSRLYPDLFDTRVHAAIRKDNWKLLTGNPGDGAWYPVPQVADANKGMLNISFHESDKNVWLFDILKDPFERLDLSDIYPDVVRTLLERLTYYNSTAVPVRYPADDLNSNPEKHGGVWGPWMDWSALGLEKGAWMD